MSFQLTELLRTGREKNRNRVLILQGCLRVLLPAHVLDVLNTQKVTQQILGTGPLLH